MAEITRDTTGNTIGTGSGGLELSPSGTDLVTINNGILLPDGVIGAPAIRFSDDTNTGILSLTNDQINFAAHGVELARFTGVSAAVNYFEMVNSITGNVLALNALGSDANITINIVPKGSGVLQVGGTAVSLSGHTHATTDITSGTFADARIAQTNVTQHQAALSITESQISDLGAYITDVVNDTTPQLGGNLDVQANSITTSTVNGGITLTPNGTGNVTLGTMVFDADQTIGAGQDNYVLTYDNAAGVISLEAAAGGGLANIVEDTTPQLGGQLDVNGNAIGDGTLELLAFTETASAVNHINITNAATGTGPTVSAVGDDVNVDLNVAAKGTGNIKIGNFTFDGDQTVGAGQDNYVLTYDNAAGVISLEAAAGGGATGYHYSGTITTAPTGTGEDTIVIGDGSTAGTAASAIVIGVEASVTQGDGIAMGKWSDSSGTHAISIGKYTNSTNNYSIAIGAGNAANDGANATGSTAIAIGYKSDATNTSAIALGNGQAAGINSFATNSGQAIATGAIAIGATSSASTTYSVAIGVKSTAPSSGLQISVNDGASSFSMTSTGEVYLSGTNAAYRAPSYANGAEPSGVSAGAIVYDSTNNKLRFYNGTSWETITSS